MECGHSLAEATESMVNDVPTSNDRGNQQNNNPSVSHGYVNFNTINATLDTASV